ncbi:hypothetical protein TIFTF001_006997 [Ficus carica]|uniref:BED-type domain-containing protein n=1 Tax=Ficus carica TaxID=3494 RepID=A0AA88D1F0_FICCA|nr:hypothetical protein TIFTF001_006997 [Ficus carica]
MEGGDERENNKEREKLVYNLERDAGESVVGRERERESCRIKLLPETEGYRLRERELSAISSGKIVDVSGWVFAASGLSLSLSSSLPLSLFAPPFIFGIFGVVSHEFQQNRRRWALSLSLPLLLRPAVHIRHFCATVYIDRVNLEVQSENIDLENAVHVDIELDEDVIELEDKKLKSACKKCRQQYLASSKYGTSNMLNHIKTCPRTETRDIGQI